MELEDLSCDLCRLLLPSFLSPCSLLALACADVGDTDNARALFERALSEPENASSAELWHRYTTFEYELGNMASAQQVRAWGLPQQTA